MFSNQKYVYNLLKIPTKPTLSFHFLFVSLIAPLISPHVNLFLRDHKDSIRNRLKNSYIVLAWFYYLTSIERLNIKNDIRFFVLPTRAQVYTLTKAPIAHKLWSKEQYKFVFYLLRISFSNCIFVDGDLQSVNQALLFLLMSRSYLPFFSSNLLTLKNAQVKISFTDVFFFSFVR